MTVNYQYKYGSLWETVRRFTDKRLAELYVRVIYHDPFFVYIAKYGKTYRRIPESLNPNLVSYGGCLALIILGDKDSEDLFIGKLEETESIDLYKVYEVPTAFTRLPVRTVVVNSCSILCVLQEC